jgi:dTDP-4-dehydrorhamnose reductase
MLRLAVTGAGGQLARALAEAAAADASLSVVFLARPALDLASVADPEPALRAARADALINAAAYTAVDQAESEPDLAMRINGEAPAFLARAARRLGMPMVQLSTDYVFDGAADRPYREQDEPAPQTAYGRSKLAGERGVSAEQPDHAILRTAWVHAPWGKNFVRTMLRLAVNRDEIAVVADQHGCPTYAPDLAAAVIAVARNLVTRPGEDDLRGVFHAAGAGEATWAGFAEAIFAGARARGGPCAAVRSIATAAYPTPARRPANSRLDGARLAARHGVTLAPWQDGLARGLDRMIVAGRLVEEGATP